MFGGDKVEKPSRKLQEANAKKNQITANRTAAKRRLPPPKPVKKPGAIPALPGTVPGGLKGKALPPPGATRSGEASSSAAANAAKQRELGYFEDQAF